MMLATVIHFDCIDESRFSPVPPWLLNPPKFIYALRDLGTKSKVPPDFFKSKLNEILADFDSYQRIYIDGSKYGTAVAAAAMSSPKLLVICSLMLFG